MESNRSSNSVPQSKNSIDNKIYLPQSDYNETTLFNYKESVEEDHNDDNPLILFEKKQTSSQVSHSKSISADYSLSSRKKNPFAQSFDSRLSEFSDNNDVFELSKKKTIDEYTGEEIELNKKYNTIGKQIIKGFDMGRFDTKNNTKNFTFSNNTPEPNETKNKKEEELELDLESINEFELSSKTKKLENNSSKINKLNLDFGFGLNNKKNISDEENINDEDEEEDEDEDKDDCDNIIKPPVKISGSSWNKPLASHSNMPKLLNAPKNKKKISFNFDKKFVLENKKKKIDLEILIPEEEENSNSDDDESEKNRIIKSNFTNSKAASNHYNDANSISKKKDRISSNSPKSCSQVHYSSRSSNNSNKKKGESNINKVTNKNFDCIFQPFSSNFDLGTFPINDIYGGAKTNPLPTCKNANQKFKDGFFMGNKRQAKRTLSINAQTEKQIINKKFDLINVNENDKEMFIEEVDSAQEVNSNHNNNNFESKTKNNFKMKINSKKSHHSKHESQIINSIQSIYLIISEFNRKQFYYISKMWSFYFGQF